MKRYELWHQDYRSRRDLDHLRPERLSERLADIINDLTVLTERKKIGVRRIKEDPEGLGWTILSTEVIEEYVLRKYPYPGPYQSPSAGMTPGEPFCPQCRNSSIIGD